MNPSEPALRWQLRRRPRGTILPEDLELVPFEPLPLREGHLRVRNIYLSLDPTHRIWMSDREQYLPPVEVGSTMKGTTVGEVVQSRSDRFKPGDLAIVGLAGWESVTDVAVTMVGRVRRQPGVPLTASLSVLGNTGLTAWFGMTRVGQVKAGDTVVVSAAAGAVGSIAGQIAKLRGARVVGIAGGTAKCQWLTETLGFDAAIDYKSEDVGAALDRHCPDGIDLDFENVGGPVMEAVYQRLNTFGRMALCGMISTYEKDGPVAGPADFSRILMRRLRIEGFVVVDHMPHAREALAELTPWVTQGQLRWKDHVVPGIENAVAAMQLLFSGRNEGKLIVGDRGHFARTPIQPAGHRMIKIVFCLKRLPGMTRAELQDYWRHKHAPLVMQHAKVLGIQRYVQSHTMDDASFARHAASRGGHPPYDGVAEIWKSDAPPQSTPEERQRAGQDLLDDERRFIDVDASPLFFTEENEVIRGPA